MKYTLKCSTLWADLPLLERPAAAKAAGFDAVDFWRTFEYSVTADSEATQFENAIIDGGGGDAVLFPGRPAQPNSRTISMSSPALATGWDARASTPFTETGCTAFVPRSRTPSNGT